MLISLLINAGTVVADVYRCVVPDDKT